MVLEEVIKAVTILDIKHATLEPWDNKHLCQAA